MTRNTTVTTATALMQARMNERKLEMLAAAAGNLDAMIQHARMQGAADSLAIQTALIDAGIAAMRGQCGADCC